MCTYRRVTLAYPDGRTLRMIVEEDPERPLRCSVCRMSEATFRAKTMTPHDDLGHQEIYHGAKVTRGRRLSAAQAAKARLALGDSVTAQDAFQVSLPGVLVDMERQP